MENNDSNLKPQSVGGLKLMTVFVVVLALHVVVIGSICTYYLLKGGNSDADALADKIHKNLTPTPENMTSTDSSTPDTSDKTTPLPANPTDTAGTTPAPVDNTMVVSDSSVINPAATPSAPATPTDTTPTPAPAPAMAPTPDSSASAQVASVIPASSTTSTTTAVPAAMNNLAPPADPTPAPAPAATAASTPVIAAAVTTASTGSTPYVVKQGDVLEKIAHRNHVSVAKLKAANSLNSDFLHIGQKLVIPAATSDTTVAATTPAPDASAVKTAPTPSVKAPAPKATTTANFTQKKNKTGIAATSSKPGYYTVVKGDNLTKIAHKFKITPNAIMTANNISDPKKLSIGEKLKIPSREARSANAAPVTAPATQLANVTQ